MTSIVVGSEQATPAAAPTTSGGGVGERAGRLVKPLLSALFAFVMILLLWIGFIHLFNINSLVAKSPQDVFAYLFTDSDAAANRSSVLHGLGQTLWDAALGFFGGMLAATAVAVIFVLVKAIEQATLPVAVVVRSIPLVAMTPLLTLIFGRGLTCTVIIAGAIVFFPALVTIAFGLRTAPKQSADLCRAYGASDWMVARKVLLPSALPALFAAARVGVPGALVGATLAEYLATGRGLGYSMLEDPNTFAYDHLWASVFILTVVSVLLYYLVAALENFILARYGPAPARR
jgi:ABC-type nitrate/sulfonate/bicarbonate transport system permease component